MVLVDLMVAFPAATIVLAQETATAVLEVPVGLVGGSVG